MKNSSDQKTIIRYTRCLYFHEGIDWKLTSKLSKLEFHFVKEISYFQKLELILLYKLSLSITKQDVNKNITTYEISNPYPV